MLRQWSFPSNALCPGANAWPGTEGVDLYLNHQLPGFTPLQHTHAKSMTVDEKCTCGFPCLPEYHALTQNRKNPEMILPVVPCLLHANWRLMEEMDHIDRLPSSQQRQRRHSAAKRPYLKGGERWIHPLVHFVSFTFERLQIPTSEGKWGKTPCSCSISVNHTPTLTAQEKEGELHQLPAPCSARNNSSRNPRLLPFTSLAASSVGTRRHTA